jgi:hypothetical protein
MAALFCGSAAFRALVAAHTVARMRLRSIKTVGDHQGRSAPLRRRSLHHCFADLITTTYRRVHNLRPERGVEIAPLRD